MTTIGIASLNGLGRSKWLVVVFFVVVLFLSLFVVYELSLSDFGGGGEGGVVFVGSERELERVVNNVWWRWGRSVVVVALNGDVVLSKPLVISDGRHVTLTSNVAVGDSFFRLVGADNEAVVFVEEGGWLCVDGVVIT